VSISEVQRPPPPSLTHSPLSLGRRSCPYLNHTSASEPPPPPNAPPSPPPPTTGHTITPSAPRTSGRQRGPTRLPVHPHPSNNDPHHRPHPLQSPTPTSNILQPQPTPSNRPQTGSTTPRHPALHATAITQRCLPPANASPLPHHPLSPPAYVTLYYLAHPKARSPPDPSSP